MLRRKSHLKIVRESALTLDSLIETYLASSKLRPEVLFRHFLPTGYRATTLSSVDAEVIDAVILAKVHLGMIITLYDDLADHSEHRNPTLLAELYTLNLGRDRSTPTHLRENESRTFELARFLFSSLRAILQGFENFAPLEAVLRFDLEQFYACNRHSELMTSLPEVRSLSESRILGPHNMGIVAAGTIDLMASSSFKMSELGQCRELFHLGQRLGRISNLLYTFHREVREGDTTNEILIAAEMRPGIDYRSELRDEFQAKLRGIRATRIHSFDTFRYAESFETLHELHASLEGRI